MSVELAHWLTEQRTPLLERCLSNIAVAFANNGYRDDPHRTTQANLDGGETLPAHETVPGYESLAQDGTIAEVLTAFYEALVLAAQGDTRMGRHALRHIHTIASTTSGEPTFKLPDLMAVAFQLRRIACEMLQHEAPETLPVLHLVIELTSLLETLLEDLARELMHHIEQSVEERIERAEFVTQSMALAMEEADRTTLKLSTLNRVSKQLAASLDSTDTADIIELVGSSILALLDVAHVSIWFPDTPERGDGGTEKAGILALYAGQCWGRDNRALSGMRLVSNTRAPCPKSSFSADVPDTDILLCAYQNGKPICESVLDPATQGAWYLPEYGVLAVPMQGKEHSSGVVLLQDPNPLENFSRAHQDLVTSIVSQSAITLENARLYAEIRRFNSELGQLVEQRASEVKTEKDRLSTINEIATEVSSTLDMDSLLNTSLAALARITRVEYGSIMLVNQDAELLVSRATLGSAKVNTFARLPIGMGIPGWVAQHKEPAMVHDVQADERWNTLPVSEGEIVQQRGSMVAVPLIAHNELLGVLTLSHEETGYFNEGHLRLLSTSAGAISMGIHNANMYNTIVGEMERSSELLSHQRTEASKTQAILQSLSDGVLVCEVDGSVLLSNPAASRILQWSLEDLFLTNLHTLVQDILGQQADALPLRDLLENPLNTNREPRMFELIVKVNMRDVQFTLGPVLNEYDDLLGALLMIRDVTREREYDRLRNEFISTMSHELRTPMTSIKGYTQLLVLGGLGPVNDTQREFLETIQSNSERMISIINDVLDITKIETGTIELEWRSLHLAEVLSSVVGELQGLKQARNHTLNISIPTGLPLVRGDTTRLHQVLNNLLSNALKYTPNGGEVWVEAHEAVPEALPEHIRSCVRRGQRYVQMDIRDTGVGIAPEDMDHVFERFYRTENPLKIEAGGTGLGLSLVKPLIELFGGFIWVQSVLNEGSTFSFILPAVS